MATTWTERSIPFGDIPYYPSDLGNGRFTLDDSFTGLRFRDLGNGRCDILPSGLYAGQATSSAEDRFKIVLVDSILGWTERSAGSTSWTERTA